MNKRINALKFALENELNEREFYLANARRTKNLAGKNMFKQIADEEKEHYEMLKKLHDQWEKKQKWPSTVSLKVKKSLTGNILKSMSEKKSTRIKGNEDDLKAVRTAIDFEARGMALYTKLEEGSTDPREKAFSTCWPALNVSIFFLCAIRKNFSPIPSRGIRKRKDHPWMAVEADHFQA